MSRKFEGVLIRQTIWLNIVRSVCAGFVMIFISFLVQDQGTPLSVRLSFPIAFPFFALFSLALMELLKLVNLGGVGRILCMIFTTLGDPLVFILFKLKPEFVPVDSYKLFNFACFIVVYESAEPEYINKPSIEVEKENLSCPFAGRIIADKEEEVFGFAWPSKATILEIDKNWNVTSNHEHFGWIDVKGQIRKGLRSNPNEYLSPGRIIGYIKFDNLYVDDKKIGKLVNW